MNAFPTADPAALAPVGQALPTELEQTPAGAMAGEPVDEPDRQVNHNEPILATGATGEHVVRLVKLLAHAGYANNTIVRGENGHNILDTSVMGDVRRFWGDHPDAVEPDTLYAGREAAVSELQGSWVGPHTWQKLYELAGAPLAIGSIRDPAPASA
jgi:hypothetical protein